MEAFRLIFAGESMGAVRVDNYPNPIRTYKTLAFHVFNFDGTVTLEGNLTTNADDDAWFPYHVETFVRPDLNASKLQNRVINFRDRVIWLRATVQQSTVLQGRSFGGRVDRVLVL